MSSCERYNVNDDTWSQMANANQARFACSSCVIKEKNVIILVGGRSVVDK